MIIGIFSGAPVWVWPLLLFLVLMGLRATRTQDIFIPAYLAMPLIAFTNLPTLQALPLLEQSLWALAYISGAFIGFRLQARWMVWRRGLRARVSGEWLSLSVMMVLFWANFANGLLSEIAPEVTRSAIFAGILATVLGLASGSFLGRPLRVLTWKRQQGALPPRAEALTPRIFGAK
ncbi:hypothetical protein [Pseudophaeobacter sp.]|uniref:hypothetical protein n=1 Tax=Pseudophaeobacter sp. TaxID=1971739 RepID=UPI004058C16B